MGFVRLSNTEAARLKSPIISKDYILNNDGVYEIDIAGKRFRMRQYVNVRRMSSPSSLDDGLNLTATGNRDYKPRVVKFKKNLSKSSGLR